MARFPVNPRTAQSNAIAEALLLNVRRVAQAVYLLPTDGVLLVDAAIPTQGIVIGLPRAHDVPGRAFIVKKIDASAHPVTLAAMSNDTIDNAVQLVLTTAGRSVVVISDGTSHWWSVSEADALTPTGVVPGTYGDATHVGQFTVDAFGDLTFAQNVAITGGSGTPGGADGDVQFNDGGAFGGDAQLTWDKTTSTLSVGDATHAGLLKLEDGLGTEMLLTQNDAGGGQITGSTAGGTLQVFGLRISASNSVVGGARFLAIDPPDLSGTPITVEDSTYIPLLIPNNYVFRSVTDKAFIFALNMSGSCTITSSVHDLKVGLFSDAFGRFVDGTTQVLDRSVSFEAEPGYQAFNGGVLGVNDHAGMTDSGSVSTDGSMGSSSTVTDWAALHSFPSVGTNGRIATRRGLWFDDWQQTDPSGAVDDQVAVDIEDLRHGVLELSLRSKGALVEMRHRGPAVFGANAAPSGAYILEALGDVHVSGKLIGSNAPGGQITIEGNDTDGGTVVLIHSVVVDNGGAGFPGEVIVNNDGVTPGALSMQSAGTADKAAPGAGYGTTYVRDNGSGKMQLVARFPTGAVQVLATEP